MSVSDSEKRLGQVGKDWVKSAQIAIVLSPAVDPGLPGFRGSMCPA